MNRVRKKVFRFLLFLFPVGTLFLLGAGAGFLIPRFFPDFSLRGISFLRGVLSLVQGSSGFQVSPFLLYQAGLFLLLYLSSFLLGLGPLLFAAFRGLVAGTSLFYTEGVLLSFPLIYPYRLSVTLLLLLFSAFLLRVGLEVGKAVIGFPHSLREKAFRGLGHLFLFFLFLLLLNFFDTL